MTAPTKNPDAARVRLTILAVIILSLFATLFARLWYLQVINTAAFQVQAQNNSVVLVQTPAPRGRILDRNGVVLVDNKVVQVVTIGQAQAHAHPDEMARLSAVLGIPVSVLMKRVDDPRYSTLVPIPIVQDADKAKVIYIREHQDDFSDVQETWETERIYPQGTLAAQLLGYVGEINGTELAALKSRGYLAGDEIGKSGIEKAYEDQLRGTPGVTKLEVNSSGRVLRELGSTPPIQGHDVYLTIDVNIQRLVEDSLNQGLTVARTVTNKESGGRPFAAPAGAAVVINPNDGSVLALASNPSYDPSLFVGGISAGQYAALTNPASHYPLTNRALSGLYPPGSTFKLATAITALKAGIISQYTTFDDKGFLKVGNQTFFNANKQVYGTVDLPRAITVSSDSYFYNLGYQLWVDRRQFGQDSIQQTANQLGFGVTTDIPVGETVGQVATPEERKRLYALDPNAYLTDQWFAGDNVNMAIGQGETVITPLELAQAYATFANGGTVHAVQIASKAVDVTGKTTATYSPRALRHLNIPLQDYVAMLQGFEGVVQDTKGTANAGFAGFPFNQYPLAGKTGTAQVSNGKQDTGLFVSFGPVPHPQYVVAVVMEESGFGGESAAPVARRIWDGIDGLGRPLQPVIHTTGVD
jgi:penicillin-binding protein 2